MCLREGDIDSADIRIALTSWVYHYSILFSPELVFKRNCLNSLNLYIICFEMLHLSVDLISLMWLFPKLYYFFN